MTTKKKTAKQAAGSAGRKSPKPRVRKKPVAAKPPKPRVRKKPVAAKTPKPGVRKPSVAGTAPPKRNKSAARPRKVPEPKESRASAILAAAKRLGIERLHREQEQVIEHLLDGRNVLMVVPTGFGKSACYQIPSMVLPQPVLVISPLLSLMRDQHQKLVRREIRCSYIDGTVRGGSRKLALDEIGAGGSQLILTTPESLSREDLSDALTRSGVSLAAVDEAHCVSEWGHDFRPTYLRIGSTVRGFGAPPMLALTATATPHVRSAILQLLHMARPELVTASPHRTNLAFEVIPCQGDQRLRALIRLVRRLRRPGIIYCSTRREVDAVFAVLQRFRVPAYRYHGGMTGTEREDQQRRYMRPRQRSVMVATNAFGLGIDKPDIRYVMHYQATGSLEQYVQEAGRAGRDGKQAHCILLADPQDRKIHEALQTTSRIRPDQLRRLGQALTAWATEERSATPRALSVAAELGPRITASLLNKMEEADLLTRDLSGVQLKGTQAELDEGARRLAGQFETIRVQDARRLDAIADYSSAEGCRAAFLCNYFGELSSGDCGICDNCRERQARPSSFFAPLSAPQTNRPRRKSSRRRRRK